MIKLIDDLIDNVAVMYRIGDIDGCAYLRLTGELLALKKAYQSIDDSKIHDLALALKAVMDV